jgi:hypothetical protein
VAAGAEAGKRREEAVKAIDKADKKEAKAVLSEEFGEELNPRLEVVDRLLKDDEALPDGAGKMIWEARTPEGRALRFHPTILRLLSEVAVNGFGEFAGYGEGTLKTGDVRAAESTRKKDLQKMMREDPQGYVRGGYDVEYRKILENEERSSSGRRSRAA